MATSIGNNNNNNVRMLSEDEQITVKPRRKSSSSKANEINKKKVARRGMGVEKLERLRLINNNNNSNNKTSSSPSSSSSLSPPFAFIPCSTIATSFVSDHHHHHHHHHPVAPVQLPFSKISGMITGVHGDGGLSLQVPQQFFVHKMGINGHTAFYPNGQLSCLNMKGNCKELPSIPTDYCSDCYKKKRGVRVTGNEMVFDGVNPSFQDSAHQGAKVVALHKKASTIGQGNHEVREYEFFPAGTKNKNKNKNKTHQINYQATGCDASTETAAAASSSCLTTTTAGSTNYIDLSLKLSY